MQRILRFFLPLTLGLTSALAQRNIGTVEVIAENKTIPVRVSADRADLNNLALQAFGAHGRYRLVASGFVYDIRFHAIGPRRVQVNVANRSGASLLNEVVAGTDSRNALLRAADAAVERTNGLGLRGFFASKLTFISDRTGHPEVYVSDLFLGDVRELTHDNSLALRPRWSPDGTKILYTSYYRSGFPDIFLINLRTFQRTTFVSFKGTNSGARYSPDGRHVAMVLTGEGNAEIYVSNAQGRMISRRTRTDAVEASPCWSPDGTRLVFTSDAAGGPQLYLMSAAGGRMRRIPTNISGYCAEPDWSRADPNKIAFTVRIGRGYQIAVYDFRQRASKQVSRASYDAVEPCWVGDGRHLIYTARSPTSSRLILLDTESGKSVPISPKSFGPAKQASVHWEE